MAKKETKKPVAAPKQPAKPAVETKTPKSKFVLPFSITDPKFPAWLSDFKIQAIIVAAISFIFYINTVQNEAAHDDTMVIVQNEYVLEGLQGIPDILSKDAYDSYYKQFNSSNQLSGGRYRPLSIITFAIEQQFFGTVPKDKVDSFLNRPIVLGKKDPVQVKLEHDMHIRHFISVLWFMASMVAFLYFLRYIVFRNQPVMALLAVVLFAIHPIHTEVVANVKSRDEIMSLLFLSLTFIYAFRYLEDKNTKTLMWALLNYFLAFLSKEYAITMLVLLPLSFYLFNKFTIKDSIKATLPYLAVVGVYILLRLQVVGKASEDSAHEILNNPYYFASSYSSKVATEISTTLNYLKLLLWPYPLSADYSYNSIPYKEITHPQVWLSLLVHGTIIWAFFYYFKRRHLLSFAIAFYMLNLLMICNIVFDIGATMGERLIYHSSVGFSIALAYFLYKGMEKIKPAPVGKFALAGFMSIVIVLCGIETIARNADWKNDITLFTHDLKIVPNSVLVSANVAASLIDKSEFEKDEQAKRADLHEGIALLNRALELHPTYVTSYLNKGLAYFKLKEPDSEKVNLDKVKSMYPNHPKLPEMYYNLGVMYYFNKNYPAAVDAWRSTLQMKPDHAQARNALQVLQNSGQIPK
jgi:protein O-mannosyl-transferase